MEDKNRANRLRRMASRQGYVLRKSRRRDPHSADYGQWFVASAATDTLVSILDNLDEIEQYLTTGQVHPK